MNVSTIQSLKETSKLLTMLVHYTQVRGRQWVITYLSFAVGQALLQLLKGAQADVNAPTAGSSCRK